MVEPVGVVRLVGMAGAVGAVFGHPFGRLGRGLGGRPVEGAFGRSFGRGHGAPGRVGAYGPGAGPGGAAGAEGGVGDGPGTGRSVAAYVWSWSPSQ